MTHNELEATEANCYIASHHLCLGHKVAVGYNSLY